MSVRNLEALFRPASIALVGASRRHGSVGSVVAHNLFNSGFEGPILPVNPRHLAIEGVLSYPDVASLPLVPDLAVIATPPDTVPGVVLELVDKGTRGIIVITAGFGEGGDRSGAARRQSMLDAARPQVARIIGPNCLGCIVPGIGLNASFSHIGANPGGLAFVTQSGAMVTAMLDWATARGVGFSHVVSLGAMADVDFGDMLDYLAVDRATTAILLYVEGITSARKFMSAARAAARTKPVIVIKAGRFDEGVAAVRSHTGALAGSDAAYDAAFRRAGMLRVFTIEELFDAAGTLASRQRLVGERLAILTNGGGMGVLATDALIDQGGVLASLSPETMAALDRVLPSTWSRSNPIDIIGDATGERYRAATEAVLAEDGVDAVLVLNCPTAVASPTDAAKAVAHVVGGATKPVFTSWLGERAPAEARSFLSARGIPSYDTPERAVRGFMHLVRYARNRRLLTETPRSPGPDLRRRGEVEEIVARAVAAGRVWLDAAESARVVGAYGIPTATIEVARDIEEAADCAQRMDFSVALKILSPDVVHKTDIGGVVLDLRGAAAVRTAAAVMLDKVLRAVPGARIDGFLVQQMIARPSAHEVILGLADDPDFGPLVLFGHGGTATEIVRDRALGLPPLNRNLARAMIEQTRIARLLHGYRDRRPADLPALERALLGLSQLAIDHENISEVDVNPVLIDADGLVAVDARVKLAPVAAAGRRLAIAPYPEQLERGVRLVNGEPIFIRPVRPEDEPIVQAMLERMTAADIGAWRFGALSDRGHDLVARLTQIDYDRQIVLLAMDAASTDEEVVGLVRAETDPDNERAQYSILVRSDRQGRGIGHVLLEVLIEYLRGRHTQELVGEASAHHAVMLQMAADLGFEVSVGEAEGGPARLSKRL